MANLFRCGNGGNSGSGGGYGLPSIDSELVATSTIDGSGEIKLYPTSYGGSYSYGDRLVEFDKWKVYMSELSYPQNDSEANYVCSMSENEYSVDNPFVFVGDLDKTYYFSMFPYSKENVCNLWNKFSAIAKSRLITRIDIFSKTENIKFNSDVITNNLVYYYHGPSTTSLQELSFASGSEKVIATYKESANENYDTYSVNENTTYFASINGTPRGEYRSFRLGFVIKSDLIAGKNITMNFDCGFTNANSNTQCSIYVGNAFYNNSICSAYVTLNSTSSNNDLVCEVPSLISDEYVFITLSLYLIGKTYNGTYKPYINSLYID